MATLHKNEISFDILPVKISSKSKKRNLADYKNEYIIFKRESNTVDYILNRNKRDKPLVPGYKDYLSLNKSKLNILWKHLSF